MSFNSYSNDFADFGRFFYAKVSWISDFFETTWHKIWQEKSTCYFEFKNWKVRHFYSFTNTVKILSCSKQENLWSNWRTTGVEWPCIASSSSFSSLGLIASVHFFPMNTLDYYGEGIGNRRCFYLLWRLLTELLTPPLGSKMDEQWGEEAGGKWFSACRIIDKRVIANVGHN